MNILGVGGPEFFIIVIIMIVIAGPKRMIHWMYIAGTYVAKFRRMWSETVDVLQAEFDEAGVGIQLPKEPPTRGSIRKQAAGMLGSVTAPVKDTMDEVNREIKEIGTVTKDTAQTANAALKTGNGNGAHKNPSITSKTVYKHNTSAKSSKKTQSDPNAFGTWSGAAPKSDFGSWTQRSQQDNTPEE